MAKTKTKTPKAAPPPDEEDEDLELEELEEDVVDEEAPKKKGKGLNEEVAFGASDLAKLASKRTGNTYNAKTIRTLLRKMARNGELDREISPENRTRYSWSGPKDPEVVKILEKIEGGAIEEARNEALAKLKEQKKAKDAAKATAKPAKKTAKVVAPPDDDDEDVEDLEDEDD